MIRSLLTATLIACAPLAAPTAFAEDETLVRLPGQGELRDRQERDKFKIDRLKPGGGLFVSFDKDGDGIISSAEINAGIPIAFTAADANQDGQLTALEQQSWAESLPTRDDSLANPVRFDPNLDRRVSIEEFTSVINELGLAYADEASGLITLTSLQAPEPEQTRRERAAEDMLDRRNRAERQRTERLERQ